MDCGMMGFPPSSPPPHPLCRLSVRPSVRPWVSQLLFERAHVAGRRRSWRWRRLLAHMDGREGGRTDARADVKGEIDSMRQKAPRRRNR